MENKKLIEVRGKPVGDGKRPLICTPLVGRKRDDVLAETAKIVQKKPDLLEWRVDFFDAIGDAAEVIGTAKAIRAAAGDIPVLFTRRSIKEGGERIALSEEEVVRLYETVCESRCVDLVDFEMSNDLADLQRVRAASKAAGIGMVMSFHNFSYTPGLETLNQRFLEAERLGADVAKVAVMPRDLHDVLTLLTATLQSSEKLRIPLVSMSMGGYGSLTRMFGWVFGSTVSFAVGASSSAPGQVPIEDLNTVLEILRKSLGGKQV
ncbi:type I 3-dehydroquinate dehydratase [Noviherbaspirillum denitrificans]|uniref:3-dehydroquinate dehydratase n=1 Tax=Noviherbaspirillum denitrificans TaxID=1968433 RepID=A0A254TCC1_9BURK|nr:type I 3-dehydroquinate dehydratase [Noviherbaspirillum denitrificans]OWW20299.1 3-dehydroquinate dehydratase [Noviherbaspirillum denitrificans]